MIRKTSVAALIGLAALAAHGSASAESIPQDAINLSNAKLSLPEAVSLAEKHHPGSKANQAELKFKKERLYYEVEVVTPKNEVFDVKVDAKDGTVFYSAYLHQYMNRITVKVGDQVTAGQTIGAVGNNGWSTGPHLHFEIHNEKDEPVDPEAWMAGVRAIYPGQEACQ